MTVTEAKLLHIQYGDNKANFIYADTDSIKGVVENCQNPDSYGMICVLCNECGRFDKEPLPQEDEEEDK